MLFEFISLLIKDDEAFPDSVRAARSPRVRWRAFRDSRRGATRAEH